MGRPRLTAKQETTVDISPEDHARLEASVATARALQEEIDLLTAQLDDEKKGVQAQLEALGVKKLKVDNVPVTIVDTATYPFFDKQKFVELGGSLKMLENATYAKPKNPYLLIGAERAKKSPKVDDSQ